MTLQEYLALNGIRVEWFAKQIGISYSSLHQIMKRKTDVRLSVALKIQRKTKGKVDLLTLLPVEIAESVELCGC